MAEKKPPFTIKGIATLASHLNDTYDIDVAMMSEMDLGVLRIDRHDGPSWVARIFPVARRVEDVRRDAAVLDALERGGFPAERNAAPGSVSVHEGHAVLVTQYIAGVRPKAGSHTFAWLGGLLGALHAREVPDATPGGGWHHLVSGGTPRDEVRAAQDLLDERASTVALSEKDEFAALVKELAALDTCEDLRHCLVHPDMVPPNAIEKDDGSLAIVDWANAGRGPRLWSLGMALFAAGARDLRLVDKFVSRYARWTSLEPEELSRLSGAIRARPLTIHAWEVAHNRTPLTETVATIRFLRRKSDEIADAALDAFTS
ncbi:MAG: phosphotransferase [Acidimicrobiales bacterium]